MPLETLSNHFVAGHFNFLQKTLSEFVQYISLRQNDDSVLINNEIYEHNDECFVSVEHRRRNINGLMAKSNTEIFVIFFPQLKKLVYECSNRLC